MIQRVWVCYIITLDLKAGKLHIAPPYLAFASLDKKSVRFTIPLCTIRRVERLNARAGVYALSLLLWHGTKIVSSSIARHIRLLILIIFRLFS